MMALDVWQGMLRYRREGAFRLLFGALFLATLNIVSIALVAQGLGERLDRSSSQFMAGDRQLESPRELEAHWLVRAERIGLRWSHAIEFNTMLMSDEVLQLVSVKAVDAAYPLLGQLEIIDRGQRRRVGAGPQPGQLWLAGRLFAQFGVSFGALLQVGDASLSVAHTLAQEPDTGFRLLGMNPRVLMHVADVPATRVIQPGSRIDWRYYFAGEPAQLEAFERELLPALNPSQRWRNLSESRPEIAGALGRTERYLMLGASLAVLLATLAVAMAARQFASGQTVTVAVLQTLGQTGPAVVRHYFAVFLGVGVLALLAGVLLGTGLANLLFRILSGLVEALPAGGWLWPGWSVLGLALLTVLATLFGFALPQLLLLQKVSPMMSLREAAGLPSSAPMLSAVLASSAIFGLLLLYTRSLTLVLGLLLAVACVVLLLALFGGFGLRVLARFLSNAPQFTSAWRQSLSRLSRHRVQSLTQGTVLALSFLLFALMWLARDSLIEDWQTQLPADAPNHFLINIAPDALTAVRGFLQQHGLPGSQLHPIVRGRLSHINGVPVSEALSREVGSLNRELNLTWMDTLPEDNRVVDGQWPATAGAVPEVSVEVALAQRIGLVVGDRVTFTLGGTELTARIGSLRTVQWDSMRPNFYVIFRPGALEPFPMTYLTAFHLAPERKSLLNHFNQQFPTVTVLELDQLIARVQGILRQASTMLALMLGFVLLAALSVVVATACSGLHNRRVEAALLRTLGATRGILMRSQLYEFGLLGLGAGVLAVLGAELAMWQLQYRLFEAPFVWHPMLWWQVPLAAGGLCLVLGWWLMREVPATPPLQILRRDR